MFYETIRQMKKQLAQVEKWLDATVSFAETKKVDPTCSWASGSPRISSRCCARSRSRVTRRSSSRRASRQGRACAI